MKTIFVACAIVTLSWATAYAQPPGPQRRAVEKEIVHGPEAVMNQLKLTESQDLQMKKLQIALMKKQAQLRSRVVTLRLESKELFLSDKIDRKALESNVKAISELQGQMKLNFVDHWFAVNAILTPEQQKIWKQHATEMGQRMGEGVRERVRERMRIHENDGGPEQDFE